MEQWCLYACELEGRPAFITCDQSAKARLAAQGLTRLSVVRAGVAQPRDTKTRQGLIPMRALGAFEAALVRAMAALGGLHVGKVNYEGQQSWYFYGPQTMRPEEMLSDLEASQRVALAHVAIDDAQHEHFERTLMPGPDELRTIRDLRALETLAAQGDVPERPRRIDYVADFMDDRARERFCQRVAEQGYIVTGKAAGKTPLPARAYFHKIDSTDLASVSKTSDALQRLVARHRGRFVGWTAQPVTQ
ncbi:MAG: DUF695 domain-containing protein [Pseudomonadota bacterium]